MTMCGIRISFIMLEGIFSGYLVFVLLCYATCVCFLTFTILKSNLLLQRWDAYRIIRELD